MGIGVQFAANELSVWVTQYGIWGVCLAAFLAATLVPISSEVAVIAAITLGIPPWHVFAAASVGNGLGASLDYGMGRLFTDRVEQRLLRSSGGRRALEWSRRKGKWSLAGSWLPVVGDPLCIAAGIFRISIIYFLMLGVGTRVMRYAVLIYLL